MNQHLDIFLAFALAVIGAAAGIARFAMALLVVPMTVWGTFHVGDARERGDLVGIYQLDCDQPLTKP